MSNHRVDPSNTQPLSQPKGPLDLPICKSPFIKFNAECKIKYSKVSITLKDLKPTHTQTYFGPLKATSYAHKYEPLSKCRNPNIQPQTCLQFYQSRPETRYSLDTFKNSLTGTDQFSMDSDTYNNDWMYFLDQDHNLS